MSTEQFKEVFERAHDIIKARYYLVAFVGLRVGEACQWSISNGLTDNYVVVGVDIAKKSARRTIGVTSDVVNWLRTNADKFKIQEPLSEKKFTYYNKKAMKENSRNVLRHSGISYKIAHTSDINQTALDFGTSVAKINSNYKELTTKQEAQKWFKFATDILKNNNLKKGG